MLPTYKLIFLCEFSSRVFICTFVPQYRHVFIPLSSSQFKSCSFQLSSKKAFSHDAAVKEWLPEGLTRVSIRLPQIESSVLPYDGARQIIFTVISSEWLHYENNSLAWQVKILGKGYFGFVHRLKEEKISRNTKTARQSQQKNSWKEWDLKWHVEDIGARPTLLSCCLREFELSLNG